MKTLHLPTSLASILKLDAATCAAMGGLLALAAGPVAQITEIPATLLFWAGLALFPVAAFMAFCGYASRVPGWALFTIIAGNALWVIASLALPLFGFIAPNAFGWVVLIGQAAVVAILAWLESTAEQQHREAV